MPTTRLASTVKTASFPLGYESSSSPAKELALETRKKRFESKKKREQPAEPTPRQLIMIQFINAILRIDKSFLLWTNSSSSTESIVFETIEDRVYKGKYKDLSAFKADMEELFLSILPSSNANREDMDAFKNLFSFTEKSLKFESARINEPLAETNALFELTALFRPNADGYSFTDLTLKDPSIGPITNLPNNVQEVIIHPALPATKDEIPLLKNVVAPPPKFHNKTPRHEDKPIIPVQWLDFGAFSSFAPASDSNYASATYENTYMARAAKRLRKWGESKTHTKTGTNSKADVIENDEGESMETNIDDLNKEWLEKEGLDIDALEDAMNKLPENISEELEKNSQLLEELVYFQADRLSGNESERTDVDEKELEVAKILEKNISDMLARLPPGATTDSLIIEKTMERLPLFEPAHRGTLPPHKIFSFPTTEKADNLPPYANITPTYSKDHWRLVKVAPVPPKDAPKDFSPFPLVSMTEQQMSFFAKPPFQQQSMPPQSQSMHQVPVTQQQRMAHMAQYSYQQPIAQRR